MNIPQESRRNIPTHAEREARSHEREAGQALVARLNGIPRGRWSAEETEAFEEHQRWVAMRYLAKRDKHSEGQLRWAERVLSRVEDGSTEAVVWSV